MLQCTQAAQACAHRVSDHDTAKRKAELATHAAKAARAQLGDRTEGHERDGVWHQWMGGDWVVKEVMAARRAPECLGGWEYRVRWEGGYDDTWEPAGWAAGVRGAAEGAGVLGWSWGAAASSGSNTLPGQSARLARSAIKLRRLVPSAVGKVVVWCPRGERGASCVARARLGSGPCREAV